MKIETKDVLSFVKEFNDISPSDLENILEYLDDSGLLNEDGKQFRTILWELFVKDHEYIIIPEENGGYSGRVKGCPGCTAFGETIEEAFENLLKSEQIWMEEYLKQLEKGDENA